MRKPANNLSPEVRTHGARVVLKHEGEHQSRWAAAGTKANLSRAHQASMRFRWPYG